MGDGKGRSHDLSRLTGELETRWIWFFAAVTAGALLYLTRDCNAKGVSVDAEPPSSIESIAVGEEGVAGILYFGEGRVPRLVLRDTNGVVLWSRELTKSPGLRGASVAIDRQGVAAAVVTRGLGEKPAAVRVTLFTRAGVQVWERRLAIRVPRSPEIRLGSQRVYLQSSGLFMLSRDTGRPLPTKPLRTTRFAPQVANLGDLDVVHSGRQHWRVQGGQRDELTGQGCVVNRTYTTLVTGDDGPALVSYSLDSLDVVGRRELPYPFAAVLLAGCFPRGDDLIAIAKHAGDPIVMAARLSKEGVVWSTRTAGWLWELPGAPHGPPAVDRARGRYIPIAIDAPDSGPGLALLDTSSGDWKQLGPADVEEIISLPRCWLEFGANRVTSISPNSGFLRSIPLLHFQVWAANGDRLWLGEKFPSFLEPQLSALDACELRPTPSP